MGKGPEKSLLSPAVVWCNLLPGTGEVAHHRYCFATTEKSEILQKRKGLSAFLKSGFRESISEASEVAINAATSWGVRAAAFWRETWAMQLTGRLLCNPSLRCSSGLADNKPRLIFSTCSDGSEKTLGLQQVIARECGFSSEAVEAFMTDRPLTHSPCWKHPKLELSVEQHGYRRVLESTGWTYELVVAESVV